LALMGYAQRGSNSRHQTRNSRLSSEGFHLSQEGRVTKTRHRLFQLIPTGVGRCSLPYCTKPSSLQEGLARRGGYPTRILGLHSGSQRGFGWPHTRSDLWVFRKSEVQGKRNRGRKDVARRYRKPEKPQKIAGGKVI
jgi:hypothetical protein